MNRKIRIGVIGAGSFASRRHIPVVVQSPEAELVALCRRDKDMLKKVAEHFKCDRTFTDYKEMLNSVEMDAVIIATPHALHYENAKLALEKGLHILVEKPLSVKTEEAKEIAKIAKDKGLIVVVALNPPYWAHTNYVRDLIKSDEIGEIEEVNISWVGNAEHVFGLVPMPDNMPGVVPPTIFRGDPKLGGGGHFIDSGSHLLSELFWTTGLNASEITAIMDDPEFDMRTTMAIKLENGAVCNIINIGNSKISRRIHNAYFGSKGTIFVDGMPFKVTVFKPDHDPIIITEKEMSSSKQPVENLIDAILGKEKPFCSAADGIKVVEAIESAYNSAKIGKRIVMKAGG
ncbi:MAG: Gfo/Idh/MocA family oxidoreductase [Candidatus Poribacteria bacterium]